MYFGHLTYYFSNKEEEISRMDACKNEQTNEFSFLKMKESFKNCDRINKQTIEGKITY